MQMSHVMKYGVFAILASASLQHAVAAPYKTQLTHSRGYTQIEVLDNDLVHIEFGASNAPSAQADIERSPMVFKSDYAGPSSIITANNVIETEALKLTFSANGCINFDDKSKDKYLTTICPNDDINEEWKSIGINKGEMQNVYGLGQQFIGLGNSDGDWLAHGKRESVGEHGNNFKCANGGCNSQLQFPIMYAVGDDNNYALLLDNVYKQEWNFEDANWWQVAMNGEKIRFYLMTGDNLLDLRKDYMQLTGTPPVPPKKTFGLWVSEFGYKNWQEIDSQLGKLREKQFPVDGFVLDLYWFGGVSAGSPDSQMGRLDWDYNNFPDPSDKISQYSQDHVGIMAIEESYVAENRWAYPHLKDKKGMANWCGSDNPASFETWTGKVGMLDWSNTAAAAWWHDTLRFNNLIDKGIIGHWTDLGEPETYSNWACYQGVSEGKTSQADIHNLYNLLWVESIYEGYVRNHDRVNRRPFTLARAATSGIQRFGAAMWSGDITARLDNLALHMNTQMHMSFSGVDFYGSDIGGFHRGGVTLDTNVKANYTANADELYSVWLANGAWFDIPVRPHAAQGDCGQWLGNKTECNQETSPSEIGYISSNRANLQQRYELTPFYYSLAYRAHLFGEPVIPPMVMVFQDDLNVRQTGHQKMIGKQLLVGVVATQGERQRDMYLPAGTWINYHTNEWQQSSGMTVQNINLYQNKVLRLPVFAQAGSIIPMMYVDEQTKDVFGHRRDGSHHDELIVKVYADENSSSFTLYEDNGVDVDFFDEQSRPHYLTRTTALNQQLTGQTAVINIAAVEGGYAGELLQRNNEIRLVVNNKQAAEVSLNGTLLTKFETQSSFEQAETGWYNAGDNLIIARSGIMAVNSHKTFSVELEEQEVCEQDCSADDWQRTVVFIKKQTIDGQDMFVRGGIDWDYAQDKLGLDCTIKPWLCALPIRHKLFQDNPQRFNDHYLDWYGAESGQGSVEGSPLVWTTNEWPADWGPIKRVSVDGYGETPLNIWGQHYWMMDVEMDCSKTVNGWFELKAYVSGGIGWEPNINQANTPYQTANHFAECGKINQFDWAKDQAVISNF